MRTISVSCRTIFLAIGIIGLMLSGCGSSGSDGAPGATGPEGAQGDPGQPGPACVTNATALTITVDKVTIGTPAKPVVDFTVKNESGYPFCGLTEDDLRFNIAKLTAEDTVTGDPSVWQNYIVRSRSGRMEGFQERVSTHPGATLVNHLNGSYTYTFATDLMNAPCPAPCTTAEGKPLDLSYAPSRTHRVGIQQGNRSFPLVNGTYDFVPAGGAVTVMRDIVQTQNCNECHNRLRLHGTRIETKFCVTCHNPGSWFAKGNSVGGVTTPTNTTVDFKVFIHKIHRSEELHQLVGSPDGNPPYAGDPNQKYLGFEVRYPQPLLNCTKCHTDSDSNASRNTPQGGNWGIKPSMEACGSCHDDIYFDTAQISPERPWQNTPHPGGVPVNNFVCHFCHDAGGPAGTIASSHTNYAKLAAGKFKFNILQICGTPVGSNPVCTPGSAVTVQFSVEDPTGAGGHGYGNFYNIRSPGGDGQFTDNNAALTMDFAWETRDYSNTDNTATGTSLPARAAQVNLRTATGITDDGGGLFTLHGDQVPANQGGPIVIPAGAGINGYTASGSGTVGIEGHPADPGKNGVFEAANPTDDVAAPVTSQVAFFGIGDTTPVPRRAVVDVATKCDNCHDILALHGANRNNNAQICVLCHNPNNTDVSRRPKTAIADPLNPQPGEGLPDASGPDGKKEEAIDFKRLIHAIHGNSEREKGIVVYGFNGSPNDFSEVEFPGILSDCHTCHLENPDTMTLEDRSGSGGANWEQPAQNGILGSTIDSAPNATVGGNATGPGSLSYELTLRADDKKISPTAAVCSSCHDNDVVKAHMENLGSALFGATPAIVGANIEQCVICHGPDALADVEVVHEEAAARAKQGL